MQNGEVIVRPTLDIIRNGSKRWRATVVGYFLGERPYFYHLKEFAMSVWPDLKDLTGTNNGFFFLQFKSVAAMEDVIEGGPWLFQGQPIVLRKWEPGMVLRKLQHTQVPVWIKLRHLLVELWTEEGLSTVASGVGKPLYPDAITRACTRLDFARVCVMLDVTSNLPKHIIIMTPDEDGGEAPCKVDVEYEWLPQKFTSCMTLGHSAEEYILNEPKLAKPPIAVYVPKVGTPQEPTMPERSRNHPREEGDTTYIPSRPTHMPDRNMSRPPPAPVVEKQREGRESPRDAAGPSREERAIWNVRGLNKRDHQLAVKDIVAEFRLQFLGLLETRVRINNVSHIQAFLLPQWKWFVDYGASGNRVWLAWDENFIDVDVVECGTQFIHCHFNIRALHESIAITVIYGANELVERRALWGSMETIAMQCTDIPWLVGGDFNAVRDHSEICGVSGDIRLAMEDFNTCIQNSGLLPLPMQGEWYTWHNCSVGPRNLWKRLDRMLINDRWMARFPTSYYSSLTARTSDHSLMVLCGDRQQQLGGNSKVRFSKMDPRKNSLSKNSLSKFSHTNASSSSLPAGDGDGEALVDGETDERVNGRWKKDGHGRDSRNRAARDKEEEETGLSVSAENAVLPPAEGSPRVSMGEDGLSTTKGWEMGAETAIADLEVGGGGSSNVDHGGPSSSFFNLDEFLKLNNRVLTKAMRLPWLPCATFKSDGRHALETAEIERTMTGKLLKARRCLLPCIAGQTAVENGGETAAKVQLPTAAAVCDSSSETGENGGISGRPMSASGRKVAANFSVAAGSPCAFFRRVGERPVTFSATGVVAGADVAAEVGDKVGEVDERAADISPIRADVMHDARAEIIHDARADVIHDVRADVIHDARADVIHDARADVIHPRADITNFMEKKTATWGKN
ncbi:UNVERIFIED_CONTAM: hypothetical protein Sindi_1294700 [Sesamum indicum]